MSESGYVGLIAGDGALPVEFAKRTASRGQKVWAIGVTPNVNPEVAEHVERFDSVPITRWGQVVQTLKDARVDTVYLLGSVSKQALYSGAPMDERFMAVVSQAPDARDNMLFYAFADDLAREGITIREQMELLPELTAQPGVLTRRAPTPDEQKDIQFALRMAKGIAGLDIGQTVVVKRQAVLAVEAIDGTNETLRRGARLGHGGVVAAKVSKPNQDLRFDVPTVGPDTVKTMIECGVQVFVFEARNTILLGKEEFTHMADEAGLTIVASTPTHGEGE